MQHKHNWSQSKKSQKTVEYIPITENKTDSIETTHTTMKTKVTKPLLQFSFKKHEKNNYASKNIKIKQRCYE